MVIRNDVLFVFLHYVHIPGTVRCVCICAWGLCICTSFLQIQQCVDTPYVCLLEVQKVIFTAQCPLSAFNCVYNMPQCHIEFSPTNFGNSKYKMYSKNQFNNLQNTMQFIFFFVLFNLLFTA